MPLEGRGVIFLQADIFRVNCKVSAYKVYFTLAKILGFEEFICGLEITKLQNKTDFIGNRAERVHDIGSSLVCTEELFAFHGVHSWGQVEGFAFSGGEDFDICWHVWHPFFLVFF
jgi:hypothetical protein